MPWQKKSLSNHTRTYSQCLLYCLFGSYSIHRSQPHVKESNVLQNERSTQNGMRKKPVTTVITSRYHSTYLPLCFKYLQNRTPNKHVKPGGCAYECLLTFGTF